MKRLRVRARWPVLTYVAWCVGLFSLVVALVSGAYDGVPCVLVGLGLLLTVVVEWG